MNQKIIVFSGKKNCGKTTTVKLVYQQLLAKHPKAKKIFERINSEIIAVLNIDGKIVGISSQGDNGYLVTQHLKTLMAKDCSIIFTATRTSGGTIKAVKSYCPPFQMKKYKQQYISDKNNQTSSNQRMAEKIVLFISNEISA